MSEQSIREMFRKSCINVCSSWRFVSVAWKLLGHGGIALPDGSRTKRRSSPRRKTIPELYKHKCRVLWGANCAEWSQRIGLCIHGSGGGDSWHHYKYKLACKEHTRVKSGFLLRLHNKLETSLVPAFPVHLSGWDTGVEPERPHRPLVCLPLSQLVSVRDIELRQGSTSRPEGGIMPSHEGTKAGRERGWVQVQELSLQ